MDKSQLLERWKTDEGKPYKGKLIDIDDYNENGGIGCMCAQGQALHLLGGWEPDRLRDADQDEADKETAKLLGISLAHAILLRIVNDSVDGAPAVVIENPSEVIGEHAELLLSFWSHLDGMSGKDWRKVSSAARAAAGSAAWDAAWDAACDAAVSAARDAARASNEIQGHLVMADRKQALFFLPMFGLTIEKLS